MDIHQRTAKITSHLTTALGSPIAIGCAITLVVVWAPSYILFQELDTWQLVINTTTTIITFLMVFIIQNTTNRETRAMNVKLDAILSMLDDSLSNPEARNLLGIEDHSEREIKREQDEVRNAGA